jgi:hypothetical protein
MAPWEGKAHRLIAAMARASWEAANRLPNGRLRRRHAPYSIPPDAARLVEILGMRDRDAAEREAKALFQLRAAYGTGDATSLD